MEVLEAIKTRRSIGKFKEKEVPKELLVQIMEAGTWAPNRYLTQPWRFFVITGEARKALSRIMEQIALESGLDPQSDEGKRKIDKEKNKPFRAPVIIAVAAEVTEGEKVLRIEELGAVYAAVENMLLAAHALGLASYWKTGKACYSDKMKKFFGLKEKDELLAFVYVGFPDMERKEALRKPVSEFIKWLENDQEGY